MSDNPVANADTAATTAASSVWLNLTGNDTDVYNYTLAVTAVGLAGTKGSVKLNPAAINGALYSPGTAFAYLSQGETATDSFTYTVSDGHGGTATATATATVTITGVNQAPVAIAGSAATDASHAASLNLLASASDVNRDDTLSVSVNTSATRGSVMLSAAGVAAYTPGAAFQYLAAGAPATDSFTDTVTDNHGASATVTDTVTITGTWLPPTAGAATAATAASHAVTLNPLAGDSDPQAGQTLSLTALNLAGANGTAVINANGTVTYTPGAAFAGLVAGTATTDSFSYTVSDGHGGSSTATVSVIVTAPGAAAAAPTALYVATNGNDAWSGRLAVPNAAGTDGPLATLQAAQAIMENSSTKITYVEGGSYYENSALTLTAADNGESWLADPGQTPIINGGQAVTGWVQSSNGIWTAPAPTGALASGSAIADLFVNGTREIHARYPDYSPTNPIQGGWLVAAASLAGEATTSSFQFNAGDIPTFASTAGLYVVVYTQNGWHSYSLPIASINYTTDTISLNGAAVLPIDQGSRYFIYNAASQLNAPNVRGAKARAIRVICTAG